MANKCNYKVIVKPAIIIVCHINVTKQINVKLSVKMYKNIKKN